MKTLKQVTESFFENTGSGVEAAKVAVWERLNFIFYKSFLEFCKEHGNIVVNNDLTVDIKSTDAGLRNNIKDDIEEFGIQFGKIENSNEFIFRDFKNLKTLKGLPKYFKGDIRIFNCPKLETLEGLPGDLEGNLYIDNCPKLETLEGLPENMEGSLTVSNTGIKTTKGIGRICTNMKHQFEKTLTLNNNKFLDNLDGLGSQLLFSVDLDNCSNLTSLKGLKDSVVDTLTCRRTNITSLEGCSKVTDNIRCDGCTNLSSLKGCPGKLRSLDLYGCTGLKSLMGCPKEIISINLFNCDNLISLAGGLKKVGSIGISCCPKLTSLTGLPVNVERDVNIEDCDNLTTFDGVGKVNIGGRFVCDGCDSLKSFKGLENVKIGTNFTCSKCSNLSSIEGFPISVGGNFNYYGTPLKFKKVDVQSRIGGKISRAR